MIYLSKLDLNRRSSQIRSELADPYQMHRTLSKAFGDCPDEFKQARLLFRVDESMDGSRVWVLAQSRLKPAWDRLTIGAAYLAGQAQVKEWEPEFSPGQHLQFRLRANPTFKRAGKRQAWEGEQDQVAWLKRKGEAGGFRLAEVQVTAGFRLPKVEVNSERWTKSVTSGGLYAELAAVRFDGVLEVDNSALLVATIESGIGSAKGFGFGLLSIARA